MRKYYFLLLLFAGLVIRILLIGNTGFIADISFWKSWSLAAVDHGIVWTTHNTNINYPPGFIYVLWLMGKIYSFFGNAHDYNSYWKENNFGFLLASKSIAIISDMVIAWLIYWFASHKEKLQKLGAVLDESYTKFDLPLILSAAFYLNPIVIMDSAQWGQVESFGLMFTLFAIILLLYHRRPYLATVIFTVGTLMKLQNIIFIPLYLLFILRYFDLKTFLKSISVAAATFFAVNLPFVLQNNMDKVLYLMTVNSDYFPWLSLNANNLWWIIAAARGMAITDKITLLGILNAKTVGLVIFSSFYLFSTILLYKKPTPRNLFLSFVLGIFAFFLFTTESHERYSYPVIVLLLFFYPFMESGSNLAFPQIKQTQKKGNVQSILYDILHFTFDETGQSQDKVQPKVLNKIRPKIIHKTGPSSGLLSGLTANEKYFWVIYILLSAAIFFNIHTGLILNYPQNGIDLLTKLTTPNLTILNSYFMIILFFLLLPFALSQFSLLFFFACGLVLFAVLIFLNSSYIFGGKVYLTSFKPIIASQGWGILQVNMTVNSYSGWKSWNRLSDDYFWYRKGFGTHASSKLVFDINREFKTFSTDFGIDTEAGTGASATFQIWGDNKELYSSPKMGRFDWPLHAEVNVTGVKNLQLIVTDAGDGINDDHADWLNPILYR